MPDATDQATPHTYDPKNGVFSICITCEGHASRRWRGARSEAEAAALNQRLSDHRARVVYDKVAEMVQYELPGFPIAVRDRAVGARHPFPTASEDNATIDRCVAVMVDLVWTRPGQNVIPRPLKKMWPQHVYWEIRLIDYVVANAFTVEVGYARVGIRSPSSKKELILGGPIFGTDLSVVDLLSAIKSGPTKLREILKFRKVIDFKKLKDLKDAWKLEQFIDKVGSRLSKGQMGKTVSFTTPPMDFDDWMNKGEGQQIIFLHSEAKTGLTKSSADDMIIEGVDTDPTMLEWGHDWLKFYKGTPDLNLHVERGVLTPQNDPQDYLLVHDPRGPQVVDFEVASKTHDLTLVSFPTGKSGWNDIGRRQQEELKNFVHEKARAIHARAVLAKPVAPRI
jgi:hypothetical protein